MSRKTGGDASQRGAESAALAGVAVALLASPAVALWAAPERGWWAPYLLWLLLIGAAAWLAHRRRHDD
jgi:peptidoglycan/LPS O-acetylase OafA/YrhL